MKPTVKVTHRFGLITVRLEGLGKDGREVRSVKIGAKEALELSEQLADVAKRASYKDKTSLCSVR